MSKKETSDLPEIIAEPCLVCGTPTTVLNFQINACRACASFYRRSINKHHTYKCQKSIGNCDVTVKLPGKVRCQHCRFQKCIKVGMKLGSENETTSESSRTSSSLSNEQETLPLTYSSTEDFAELFNKTVKIFEEPSFSFRNNINTEFSKLLEAYIKNRKPQKALVHYLKVDVPSYNRDQEEDFIRIAGFLNSFEPFSSLNLNDKKLLFKKFWEIFSGLEKFYQSCLYFGNDPNDLRVALFSYYIDYDELINDAKDVIPGETDKAFLIPMLYKARKIFKQFKKLNITLFELAYMAQIALWWCYDVLGISETTQKIAEQMLEYASNELHDFYVNELGMPFYATRQSQLFKVVQRIEINVKTRKEMFLAKEIFDFGSNINETNDFFNRYYKHIKKE